METTMWMILGAIIVIALIYAVVLVHKNKKLLKPWTDETWIESGGMFLLIGYVLSLLGIEMSVLMAIGSIYFVIGFVKKHIIKEKKLNE
ncbi:MAG: hypothetical protein PHC66_02010, partial [Candidatus Nanoarchaeia archaeon]|nr:hypothetical protein [Candidatus Nanoarchaeia archaeon]